MKKEPILVWQGVRRVAIMWKDSGYTNETNLHVGKIYVGCVSFTSRNNDEPKSWRAWIMRDNDGETIGYYDSEQKAKDELIDAVIKDLERNL